MSMIQSDLLLGQEGGAGYTISRSLRFNSSDSAYLSRTPASAGNRKTWTWAGWVKKSKITSGDYQFIFGAIDSGATAYTALLYSISDDALSIWDNQAGTPVLRTSQVFRDASAWFHVVWSVDTTQSTASNRMKLYVNGSEVTAWATDARSSITQNLDLAVNRGSWPHSIGSQQPYAGRYFDGYLADIHFIDGQALTPSSFTEVSATTGQLIPKAYTGTFTGNSFWLKFADNSAATATTLGKDSSGLGNNWTPNNLSVTAGAGNDSLVDTPSSAGTDTGVGGQVTGNYCTLNPLANPGSSTLSNGNLDLTTASASYGKVNGTIGVSSGKWYWEVVCTSKSVDAFIGVEETTYSSSNTYTGGSAGGVGWYDGGTIYSNDSSSSYGTLYAANDVIGVALNMDAGTLVFYKNGVSAGTAKSGLSGTYAPSISDGATSGSGNTYVCNFGQRSWAYAAPAGFKALCDTNLPAPLVAKPNTVFDALAFAATDTNDTVVTGLNFQPDLVWGKSRTNAYSHQLFDSVRGVYKSLTSNNTNAESNLTVGVTSFNSDGFTAGRDFNAIYGSGSSVAWCWDAGSSTVTNTQGSITSQVRANPSAGFSIVTYYHGSGVGASTIGHGLNSAPHLILSKYRDGTTNWDVYVRALGPGGRLILNSTGAFTSETEPWNNTNPTSTVFSVGPSSWKGVGNHVAYCFAPVAGLSSFGSYQGNGSADGPFVFTGFKTAFVMLKTSSAAGDDWYLYDYKREAEYNPTTKPLFPNGSYAEQPDSRPVDLLSNGFKIRNQYWFNANGATVIYCAFAQNPFQYARAR